MKEFLFFSDVHGDVRRDDVFFNEAEQRSYMILSKGLLSDLVDVSISTPGENPVFSAVGKKFIDSCKRQVSNIVLSYEVVEHPHTKVDKILKIGQFNLGDHYSKIKEGNVLHDPISGAKFRLGVTRFDGKDLDRVPAVDVDTGKQFELEREFLAGLQIFDVNHSLPIRVKDVFKHRKTGDRLIVEDVPDDKMKMTTPIGVRIFSSDGNLKVSYVGVSRAYLRTQCERVGVTSKEYYDFEEKRRKMQSNEKSKRVESLMEIATHVAHADIRAEDVFDKSAREDVKVYLHRDSHIPRTIIAETEGYVILKDDRNGREMCMNRRKFEEKYFEAEKHVMSKFFIVRMNSVSGPIDTKKEALEIFKIAKTEKDRAIAIREIDFTTYREVEKK